MYLKTIYRVVVYKNDRVTGRLRVAADDLHSAHRAGKVWAMKDWAGITEDDNVIVDVKATKDEVWVP